MKKIFYTLVLVVALASLSACSGEQTEFQDDNMVSEAFETESENSSRDSFENNTYKNIVSIKKNSKPFGAYNIALNGNEITGIIVNNSDERAKWNISFDAFDENGESNTSGFLVSGGFFLEFLEPGEEDTFSVRVKEGTVSFAFKEIYIKTETDINLAEAENLILYGNHAEAMVILDSILEAKPDNIEAKRLMARIKDAQNEISIEE